MGVYHDELRRGNNMAGTAEGAAKRKARLIEEIGEEEYKKRQSKNGKKGGLESGKTRRMISEVSDL